MNGVNSLIKESPQTLTLLPWQEVSEMMHHERKSWPSRPAIEFASSLILDSPASRTVRNELVELFLSHLSYGVLLQQLEGIKTVSVNNKDKLWHSDTGSQTAQNLGALIEFAGYEWVREIWFQKTEWRGIHCSLCHLEKSVSPVYVVSSGWDLSSVGLVAKEIPATGQKEAARGRQIFKRDVLSVYSWS